MAASQTLGRSMETKREIRKRILALRDQLSDVERMEKSVSIVDTLLGLEEYEQADRILSFVSYQSEVELDAFLIRCFQDGKQVFVPLVCGDEMRFFEITSMQDLNIGYKGILEPAFDEEKEYLLSQDDESAGRDLMIMPGAAFDTKGNRIGYGKGFYDKFLSKGFDGTKLAVAYELQIVPENSFEAEETDIRPDQIITEKGIMTWI